MNIYKETLGSGGSSNAKVMTQMAQIIEKEKRSNQVLDVKYQKEVRSNLRLENELKKLKEEM